MPSCSGDLAGVLRRERSPAIIEKDFWVCWALHRLFDVVRFRPQLIFKGGTSLSKAYNAVERFSEDVDLSLSRRDLGFADSRDPEEPGISGKESQRRIEALVNACRQAVVDRLLPGLRADFAAVIGPSGWSVELDAMDPQTVIFTYPRSDLAGDFPAVIRPAIRLEMGAVRTTGRRRSVRFALMRQKRCLRRFRQWHLVAFVSWTQGGLSGRRQRYCTPSTTARLTRPWRQACRGITMISISFHSRRLAGRHWIAPIFWHAWSRTNDCSLPRAGTLRNRDAWRLSPRPSGRPSSSASHGLFSHARDDFR